MVFFHPLPFRSAFSALFWSVVATGAVGAQDIDPRGIYFNDFVGSFNGTEWFQVTPVGSSTTSYRIRDIYGGGFTGTITPSGEVIIPGASMNGAFNGPDFFVIFPFNGQFTFSSSRVPTTDVDFPLTLDSPQAANPLLDDQWSNTFREIDPQTGQVGTTGTEIVTVTTSGTTIRVTDSTGEFFQGVFEDGLRAGFRALDNPFFGTPTGIFASFPGSETNSGLDILGELELADINHFRASFLRQTRTALGNQTQTLVEYEAARLVPLAAGDANGDGLVDAMDESLVAALLGATFEDSNYNLAADINADGQIDGADLAFYNGPLVGVTYCGPAEPNSTGVAASLVAAGSSSVVDNDIALQAFSLPPGQLVLGVTSQTQGFTPMPGISQGNLCLGGAIGRFLGRAGISSALGTFEVPVDLTAIPQPSGSSSVVAGETWNFQVWYRDVVGGQGTSNFSAGVSVTFD